MNITLIFCLCTADGFPITKERRKVIIDAQKPYNISATGSKSCTYQVVDRCAQRLSMAQVPPPLGWPGLGQVGSGADRLPASFAQGASEFGTLTRFGEVPFLSGRVRSGLHQPVSLFQSGFRSSSGLVRLKSGDVQVDLGALWVYFQVPIRW